MGADAGGDVEAFVLATVGVRTGWATGRAAGVTGWAAGVAAIRWIDQLDAQNEWIDNFDHSDGQIAGAHGVLIEVIEAALRGEDLCATFAAEKNDALVKDGKTGDLNGTGGTYEGLCGDAIEVTNVDAVKAAIKTGWLYIDLNIQELRFSRAEAQGAVDNALGALGWVKTQVLDAVTIAATVVNLFRVYANSFSYAGRITDWSWRDPFTHE